MMGRHVGMLAHRFRPGCRLGRLRCSRRRPPRRRSPDGTPWKPESRRSKGSSPTRRTSWPTSASTSRNLWFAGEAENWPLADFYLGETKSHLRWAVRRIPIRKDNQGRDVNLVNILEAFENSQLTQLKQTVDRKDRAGFERRLQGEPDGVLLVPQGRRQALPPAAGPDRARGPRSSTSTPRPTGRSDNRPAPVSHQADAGRHLSSDARDRTDEPDRLRPAPAAHRDGRWSSPSPWAACWPCSGCRSTSSPT